MTYRNRIGQVTATTGTGAITLGAAITDSTNGDLQALGAGDDGDTFDILIIDGGDWEVAVDCAYTHGTTSITRGTLEESSTGSALDLSGNAKVYVTASAAKLQDLEDHIVSTSNPHTVTYTQVFPTEVDWDDTNKTLTITGDAAAYSAGAEAFNVAGRIVATRIEKEDTDTRPVTISLNTEAKPDSAPSAYTDYHGIDNVVYCNHANANNKTRLYPFESTAKVYTATNLSRAVGGFLQVTNAGTSTVTDATGLRVWTRNTSTGTITTAKGIDIDAPTGGTIGTAYGIYINDISAASTNYSIYAAGGDAYFADALTVAGTVTVPNGSFTYAKLQDVSATDKLLGRATAGSGDIEEITCTAAGRALLDDADAAAQRATLSAGYSIGVCASTTTVADATTYYWGLPNLNVATTATRHRIYIPRTGILKVAYVFAYCGAASTNENWEMLIRHNDTTDYSIATVGNTEVYKTWSNTGLSISVTAGDYIEMKTICPTWATEPGSVRLSGTLWIE